MDSVRLCRAGLTDVLWQIFLSPEFGTKLQIFEDAQISLKHGEGRVNGSLNAKNQLNLSSWFFVITLACDQLRAIADTALAQHHRVNDQK